MSKIGRLEIRSSAANQQSFLYQAISSRTAFRQPFLSQIQRGEHDERWHSFSLAEMINNQFDIAESEWNELVTEVNKLVQQALVHEKADNEDLRVSLLKEMADVVFTVYQLAAMLGLDLDNAMHRIYQSNMTKLDNDGNPVYNEVGKVMKGSNYAPPNLGDLV